MLQSLPQLCVALLQFLKQPHVLDSDDSLIGESLEQRDLLLRERTDFCTTNCDTPNGPALPQQWRYKHGSSTSNLLRYPSIRIFRFDLPQYVVYVDRLTVEHSPACRNASTEWYKFDGRHCPVFRHDPKLITFRAFYQSIVCVTQSRSIFRNHIQHRLDIRRRAGDHAKNLTRRRLLLQRFLQLVEQSHVLDSNHRLVSEGLK